MKECIVLSLSVLACNPASAVVNDDAATGRDDATIGGSDATAGGGRPGVYQSGSRIRMKMLNTPDGAKMFWGTYDSQRAEDCNFTFPSSDGVVRCLPSAASLSYFGDASCSTPVAIALACAPPKYVTAPYTFTGCPNTLVTGAIYNATQLSGSLFSKSGTACIAAQVPAGYAIYGVSGPEIPPATFQSSVITTE